MSLIIAGAVQTIPISEPFVKGTLVDIGRGLIDDSCFKNGRPSAIALVIAELITSIVKNEHGVVSVLNSLNQSALQTALTMEADNVQQKIDAFSVEYIDKGIVNGEHDAERQLKAIVNNLKSIITESDKIAAECKVGFSLATKGVVRTKQIFDDLQNDRQECCEILNQVAAKIKKEFPKMFKPVEQKQPGKPPHIH